MELSTQKDYRRDKLQNVNTYFSKLKVILMKKLINCFINYLTDPKQKEEILVKGRKINV